MTDIPQDTHIAQPQPNQNIHSAPTQIQSPAPGRDLATPNQIQGILRDYKQCGVPLPECIYRHTGIHKAQPEFMEVIQQIQRFIKK